MTNDDFPSSLDRRDWIRMFGAGSVAALAGCLGGSGGSNNGSGGNGGSNSSGGNNSGSENNNGGNGGSGKDVLIWSAIFDDSDSEAWFDWYQKTFRKNHSNATLKTGGSQYATIRKKYLTGAKQGKPDAVEGVLSHLTEYQKAGLIQPFDDRAKKLDYFDGYLDNTIKAVSYKGKLYGLPYTGNGRALVYRKDIFDKHGLKPPKTTADFMKAGRTIKAKEDITPFHNCTKKGGVRAFQEWISHMYQVVDQVYEPKGDSWKVVPSAKQIGQVFDDYYYKPWASDNPIADTKQLGTGWQTNDYGYVNGKYAMIPCGPWLAGFVGGDEVNSGKKAKKIINEKTAIAPLPHPKSGHDGTYLEVKPVMMNKYTKVPDLAFDTIKHFASPTSIKKRLNLAPNTGVATPVHKDVKPRISIESWRPFVKALKSGTALAQVTWGPVREALYPLQQQVAYGKTDPYKAGKQFHKKLKSLESSI